MSKWIPYNGLKMIIIDNCRLCTCGGDVSIEIIPLGRTVTAFAVSDSCYSN